MEEKDIKQMSIRVKCGTAERELSFPVPAEMVNWMGKLQLPDALDDTDPMKYTVEGNRKIQMTVSLYDIRRKF
ncbi:MAG: hypothetical protein NC131_19760 [Roseburia sp.]|nr:hypothetical protein [Roseburia sp.]